MLAGKEGAVEDVRRKANQRHLVSRMRSLRWYTYVDDCEPRSVRSCSNALRLRGTALQVWRRLTCDAIPEQSKDLRKLVIITHRMDISVASAQ